MKRREFVHNVGLAIASVSALGERHPQTPWARTLSWNRPSRVGGRDTPVHPRPAPPATVSLVKGNDRRQVVYDSLKKIENEILASIGDKQVLIKPNMCVSKNPLAVTHPDAVRAVLDFFAPHYKKTILVGESGVLNTLEGYRNNGYEQLEKEYNVRLLDLNEGAYRYWYVFGKEQNPQRVRIISAFLDPNVYVISLARMKTHDCVLVTLSLKNTLMAAPLNDYRRSDKGFLHGPAPAADDILRFNLFHLAHQVWPDLAVIDGFEAMEGDGPAWGTPFEARVALASRDALAADVVATKIMGFDPRAILYLSTMTEAGLGQGDGDRIQVVGTPLDQCLYKFKPNKRLVDLYKLS
jgi:uncharacterized protein (DUF362 family)